MQPANDIYTIDSDDDIIPLNEAPELFKKKPANRSDPIEIPDSPEALRPIIRRTTELPCPLKKRSHQVAFDDEEDELDQPGPSKRVVDRKPSPAALALGWDLSPDDLAPPHAPLSDDASQAGSSTEPLAPPVGDAKSLLPGVLEILPDLCSTWAMEKLEAQLAQGQLGNCVATVLAMALEVEGGYPIAQKSEVAKPAAVRPIDYKCKTFRVKERRGFEYSSQCLAWLDAHFRFIPVQFIKNTWMRNPQLVTGYYALKEASAQQPTPFQVLRKARARCAYKGKAKEEAPVLEDGDPFVLPETTSPDQGKGEFERERAALLRLIDDEEKVIAAADQKQQAIEEAIADGSAVQCCICFSEDVPTDMFYCPNEHPYCHECAQKHVEMHLERSSYIIVCGHQDGCDTPLTETEINRFLSATSLKLYNRIRQAKELDEADIEGLEGCPRCPFAMVLDNPDEKLFRCLNQECGAVTCRKCKRLDHIPKICAEMEADSKLNKLHAIEDAMSEALFRRCPNAKCRKPFTKESGCNKMVCSSCGVTSCYMCRQIINNGYQHFDQDPHEPGVPRKSNKCLLWDRDLAQQDARAVMAARDAAQAEVRAAASAEGLILEDQEIDVHVDMPAPAPAPAGRVPPPPAQLPNVAGAGARNLPGNLPVLGDLVPMAVQRQFQNFNWNQWPAFPDVGLPLPGVAGMEGAPAQPLQNAAGNAANMARRLGDAVPLQRLPPVPVMQGALNRPNLPDMAPNLQLAQHRANQPDLLQQARQQQADIAGALVRMRQVLAPQAPRGAPPAEVVNHPQPVALQPNDLRHVRFDEPPAPPAPDAAQRNDDMQQILRHRHERNEQMARLRQARRALRRQREEREQQLGAAAALT